MKNLFQVKIGTHFWTIKFIPAEQMRDNEWGTCWSLKRTIDIDDSLDFEEAKIILGHELIHAFLTAYGDVHQTEFNEEKICDFVSWNMDEIISIRNDILGEKFDKKSFNN